MKAVMEWIGIIWERYWGEGYYQYLLLAAVVYLLIFHRKDRCVRQALSFSACLLFVFLFPLTAKCIIFCIGDAVYWRVLWLLPTIPLIAMAATKFLSGRRSRSVQAVLLLLCCGIIALSGKDMLSADNFTWTNNRLKVPDDIAHVVNLIRDEAEKDGVRDIFVMGDDYMTSYLRVYDPSIRLGNGRGMAGVSNHASYRTYRQLIRPKRNYRKIAKLCKKAGCNFVVLPVPENKVKRFTRRGYVKIGDVGSYSVFQLEES